MKQPSIFLIFILICNFFGSTFANQDDETSPGKLTARECDLDQTCPSLNDNISPQEDSCVLWAKMGLCNSDTEYMLRHCTDTCFNDTITQTQGLLAYGPYNKYRILLQPSLEGSYMSDGIHCIDSFDPSIHLNTDEEGCEIWSQIGECINNPSFMLKHCAKSCFVCLPAGTTTFPIGEPQVVSDYDYYNETIEVMIRTANYMKNVVMGSATSYYPVRATCRNKDPLCSEWAAQGYCHPDNKEFQFMIENCSPSCHTCHLLDCNQQPVQFLKEGDLDIMFERIVGDRYITDYQVENGMPELMKQFTVHSRPTPSSLDEDEEHPYIIGGPWIVTIDDFLTPEECDFLIEMGHEIGYSRSTETNINGTDYESKFRTSSNTWCRQECQNHPITKRIFEKMKILTGLPSSHAEQIQLLRYEPGEFYRPHHDFVSPHLRRILTFFLYLEDEGLEGGGTRFTNLFPDEDEPLSIEVSPKKGRALIWPNVLSEDPMEKDLSTYHEGMSVEQGVKYAANVWFHNYDLSMGYNLEC